ncbi:MAG: ATP-binding protein [Pseudomonadales bacterium]|nr:ATP-binding protein [Pseudomonadales bacterium]
MEAGFRGPGRRYDRPMERPAPPGPDRAPGLTARVVAVVVLVAALVLALDTVATRWAFQKQFLAYVNEQEAALLERMAERLAEVHSVFGSWEAVEAELSLRRVLLWSARISSREIDEDLLGDRRPARRGDAPPPPGPPEHPLRRPTLSRLVLLDADGTVLVPSPIDRTGLTGIRRQPVLREGRAVATIELLPARRLDLEADRRFEREHLGSLWRIAAAALLLATAAGWLLARSLLAPVRALAGGARALAAGRYETRLTLRRQDELGALARDFNLLAEALERARTARQRWLADVAHELRTPLTVLRGEVEALVDGVRPADGEALASLAAETQQLARLVEDLHALALADAGALAFRFEREDLGALLEEAVERQRPRFGDAGLRLEYRGPSAPLQLPLDADRIGQLLLNLLENALRYTDPPGPVRVTLAAAGDGARVTVEDGPPGVPEADRPRLFERFWRRDAARARVDGGSGLGLAIVLRIAEAHGGTATARASSLGGLAVDVFLGAQPEAKRDE